MTIVDKTERTIVERILRSALADGCSVRVHDEEDWACDWTDVLGTAMSVMNNTDIDYVHIRAADGTRIGSVMLVYGNGADVVSDCTVGKVEEYVG